VSRGPRGLVGVGFNAALVAAAMVIGSAPVAAQAAAAQQQGELERRAERRRPSRPTTALFVPRRALGRASKKRSRVCTRKPPKRGKTAAALRRYGYSRA
jgi:hypothetical protein